MFIYRVKWKRDLLILKQSELPSLKENNAQKFIYIYICLEVHEYAFKCSNYECNCLQAKVGREKEFEASLQHLRGKDTDISFEASDIKVTF